MKNCPFINQRLCGETFAPNNYVRPNAMPPESKADAYMDLLPDKSLRIIYGSSSCHFVNEWQKYDFFIY